MNSLKLWLTVTLCACSIISCFCWAKSALATVPAKIPGSHLVWVDDNGFETDLVATAQAQTRWNRVAAAFASVAAIAQAALVVITW